MKKILALVFPILVGAGLVFFAIPLYGGDLDIIIQKIAIDWEMPVVMIRILLSIVAALVLTLIFGLVKRLAVWAAVIIVLASLFAPALLSDLPSITDDIKTTVEEKLNL